MDSSPSLAKVAQHLMVENQLRANQVSDPRLVEAFTQVPRHIFARQVLPKEQSESLAYADKSIALGAGRWLLEPRVLGRLLQAADIGTNDAVLDICCATGYATALASHLAALAVGVDTVATQVSIAEENLHNLGLTSGLVITGDPQQGAENYAPYDVILIGGAIDFVPPALLQQLAEGGRLVTVLRKPQAGGQTPETSTTTAQATQATVAQATTAYSGCGVLYRRFGEQFPHRPLFDANVPALAEFIRKPEFVF